MIRTIAVIAATLALIPVIGCGGGGEEEVLPALRYLPLEQGNWWRYEITDYTVNGAGAGGVRLRLPLLNRVVVRVPRVAAAQGDPGVGLSTTSITGTRTIAGSQWYEATTTLHDSGVEPSIQYFRHDANGLQSRASATETAYYRIYAPITPGTTWNPDFDANDESTILSVSAEASVEAGVFTECVLVAEAWDEEEGRVRIVSWFAPDVGMVRSEDYLDGTLTGKAEMTTYRVSSH